jgi:CheY-like chemotaxis protein
VIELLWLLAGAFGALLVQRVLRRANGAQASPAPMPAPVPATASPTTTSPTTASPTANPTAPGEPALPPVVPPTPPATTLAPPAPPPLGLDAHRIAHTLADELATLLSGVEGRAHHLIEAAPDRTQLPHAAEGLLAAIQRLRVLHSKLVAFSGGRHAEPGVTALEPLLRGLSDELQVHQLGLEVRRESAMHVPPLAASPHIVHDALLFLGAAILRAERGANNLTLTTELCFRDDEPQVQIELALEWAREPLPNPTPPHDDPAFTLDFEAANHLIASHGGELSVQHLPGRSICAVVRWPLARRDIEVEPAHGEVPAVRDESSASTADATPRHVTQTSRDRHGGALVLESDPAVRALLSQELKAAGRAVFACADGAAARTFLEATPDRFELLVVDEAQRLDATDPLAATIRRVAPRLRILALWRGPLGPQAEWPGVQHVAKPFGVHELRAALASILTAG